MPESSKPTAPATWGEAIEVPFISWVPRIVNWGTEVIAPGRFQVEVFELNQVISDNYKRHTGNEVCVTRLPPGAHMVTPLSPSMVGPRDVHVKGVPGSFSLVLYIAVIISGLT